MRVGVLGEGGSVGVLVRVRVLGEGGDLEDLKFPILSCLNGGGGGGLFCKTLGN